jgi:hypothetical protein
MLRPRKSDSIEHRRRQLELQERLLAEKMARLSDQLSRGVEGLSEPVKPPEPPVWRLEEDSPLERRAAEPAAPRKRNLGRQRQRDMIIFFFMMGALIILIIVVLSLHAHSQPINGV